MVDHLTTRCTKCGSTDVVIQYLLGRKDPKGINVKCETCDLPGEHFRVRCDTCGYREHRQNVGTIRVTKGTK
jgi:hypothetical protein